MIAGVVRLFAQREKVKTKNNAVILSAESAFADEAEESQLFDDLQHGCLYHLSLSSNRGDPSPRRFGVQDDNLVKH